MKLYFVWPLILQSTLWWIVMKPFTSFFFRLEVKGLHHLKDISSPAIFAPNHSHPLDSELLPLALPIWSRFSPMFYVTLAPKRYTGWKKVIFTTLNLEHIGAYAFTHDKKDYALSLKKHVSILKDGGSVCIFPEGSMTKNGLIGHARGGVSYLASETEAPIVPVLIQGTYKLTLLDTVLRRRKVTIEFFPAVHYKNKIYSNTEATAEEYRANAEQVLDVIRKGKGE